MTTSNSTVAISSTSSDSPPSPDSGNNHQYSPKIPSYGSGNMYHDGSNPNIVFQYPAVLKPYRTNFNSIAASLIAVATGFPLDSVKTRLQTYKYNGNWHCIVDTYKNEGVIGFFRGKF